MKDIWIKIGKVVGVLIVIYCLIITCLILCKNKYGFPTIGDNTLVVVDKERAKNLDGVKKNSLLVINDKKNYKEGDIIYYFVPKEEEYILKTSKIEKVDEKKFIYIKNDNSETKLANDKVAGKKMKEYKGIGKLLGIVSSQGGFFFLVIFPTVIVFIYLIRELIALLKENDAE